MILVPGANEDGQMVIPKVDVPLMDLSESLTQFCQLTPELSDLVLGFRIGRTNRKPSLNMLSYDLCRKFGTRSFV